MSSHLHHLTPLSFLLCGENTDRSLLNTSFSLYHPSSVSRKRRIISCHSSGYVCARISVFLLLSHIALSSSICTFFSPTSLRFVRKEVSHICVPNISHGDNIRKNILLTVSFPTHCCFHLTGPIYSSNSRISVFPSQKTMISFRVSHLE